MMVGYLNAILKIKFMMRCGIPMDKSLKVLQNVQPSSTIGNASSSTKSKNVARVSHAASEHFCSFFGYVRSRRA